MVVIVTAVVVVVQNWKLRWFVLQKNELRYYTQRSSPEPIRTMDLRECKECFQVKLPGQEHCFSYVVVLAL